MTTQEMARPEPLALPEALAIVAVPVVCAAVGLTLRYLAWRSTGGDADYAAFAEGLCRFDCHWYVRIAEEGYDRYPVPWMGNWAFFPLDPLVMALIHWFVAGSMIQMATAVSILVSGVAVVLSWPLFEGNWRGYILFAVFVLCGPFSVYFTTFYSETAFLMLTIAVFVQLQRSRYLAAGIFGALLSATRIVGVFAVVPILVQVFEDHRAAGGRVRDFPRAVLGRADLVLAILVAPLGLFIYMSYLYVHMGDGLAFQHVQRAWARILAFPLWFLWIGITDLPDSGWWPSPHQLTVIAIVSGFALTGWLFWRRQHPAAWFSLICLLLPSFAGLASMLRFTVAQAPLMIALMKLLARWRPVFALALLGMLAGDFYVTEAWVHGFITLI
jgi:hypothetical protein